MKRLSLPAPSRISGLPSTGFSLRLACVHLVLAAVAASLTLWADSDPSRARTVRLNADGGWCWFQDERAVVRDGQLIFGSVASGFRDPKRKGDIEATVYDLRTGALRSFELHDRLELDDHAAPAFVFRADGRLLAVWAKHGSENRFYYRISASSENFGDWGSVQSFSPSASSRITYSNLFRLSAENGEEGRIYNFFRGLDNLFKPSFAYSDDGGETWEKGNVVIDVPSRFRHRPYVKYASNGRDVVHFFYTEGHPRDFDNSLYHAFYREGVLHQSDGRRIAAMSEGLSEPEMGTRVFAGDARRVAWTSDLHLDREGRPYAAASMQMDQNDRDHRYLYARWDGDSWSCREIARAGSRLYSPENDYTGNIALDPNDPFTAYISSDVDPVTGRPLSSGHYEIFKGQSEDQGATWAWTPLTRDSEADNLRPIVPTGASGESMVLWLRGTYRTYRDYDLEVMGRFETLE